MTARIKLLTPWVGELPSWLPQFQARMEANSLIDWELLPFDRVDEVNELVEARTGLPCRKATAHALCDLRPLFGYLFTNQVMEFEWWGWCDLDIVAGALDNWLPQQLNNHDAVSAESWTISGPLSMFKNTPELVMLWKKELAIAEILADPDYCNFDESGFNVEAQMTARPNSNPHFTRLLKEHGFKVHFSKRSATDATLPESTIPARSCRIEMGALLELPTESELWLYHFARTKKWPLPNRHGRHRKMQMDHLAAQAKTEPALPPLECPETWSDKFKFVTDNRQPKHCLAAAMPVGDWLELQRKTAEALQLHVPSGSRLLDAGCGHGAMIECLTLASLTVLYEGVDYCSELLSFGESMRRSLANKARGLPFVIGFTLADLRALPFSTDQFDVAVCRGVEGSTRTTVGNDAWRQIVKELLRVAPKVLVIDMEGKWRVIKKEDR